jgi:hypothetical protein
MTETELAKKTPKSEVDYGDGTAVQHCGTLAVWPSGACRHFIPPHACHSVAGHIDRDGWCRRWQSAKTSV